MSNAVEQFFLLGMRRVGGTSYEAAGIVLSAVPGIPFYVDASALALGEDGLTPATAFPSIEAGV
ncbi:MAG: hypothetical protein ACYTG5_21040, partial [Planctomycetota bacterium]